jgi:hypothetical protein
LNINIYPKLKSYQHLLDSFPPVLASQFLPEWYKKNKINNSVITATQKEYIDLADKTEKFNNKHAKNCPAIQEYLLDGIVIRSWSDIFLSVNKDGSVSWKVSWGDAANFFGDNPFELISSHISSQVKDMGLNEIQNYGVLKLNAPFYIETSPGYGLEFVDPFYHHRRNIKLLPGIVETDKWHEVNFPFEFLYDTKRNTEITYTIKAGDPLIMARPRLLDNIDVDLKVNKYSEEFINKQLYNLSLLSSLSNTWTRYKKFIKGVI